jgi:hypothetical protein
MLAAAQIDGPAADGIRLLSLKRCSVVFQSTIALEVLLEGLASQMFWTIRRPAMTVKAM